MVLKRNKINVHTCVRHRPNSGNFNFISLAIGVTAGCHLMGINNRTLGRLPAGAAVVPKGWLVLIEYDVK